MNPPWFRFYAEFAGDAVVQSLSFEDQRHYVMILCLKCSGVLDRRIKSTVRDTIIYRGLGLDPVTALEVRSRLIDVGLITEDWQPCGWDKRQPNKDSSTLRPSAEVWQVIRARIFERDDYTCQYCGERGGKLECDHVMPVSRGGGHDNENLVTACLTCNRAKHTKTREEWLQ